MNGVPDFIKASSRGQGCLAEYACSFDVLIYNKVRIQSDQQISVQIFYGLEWMLLIFCVPNC
jgi:hypothetical protein